MRRHLKAALLSGLVFPGLGQIALGARRRGALFLLPVLIGTLVIVVEASRIALAILARIDVGGGVIDMATLWQVSADAVHTTDTSTMRSALVLVIVAWLTSVVDAWRLGRQPDTGAPPGA